MTQYFKGDAVEQQFYNAGKQINDDLSMQKDLFFAGAFSSFILGELLYDSGRAPLANAIDRTVFRESFATIFETFVSAGTFEGYLTVFRKIFGDTVDVTFTVPSAGKLQIAIEAEDVILSNFVARRIENNDYVFDAVVDDTNDNILFQTLAGFESQYELEQMLYELVPAGIYTEITLTLGG